MHSNEIIEIDNICYNLFSIYQWVILNGNRRSPNTNLEFTSAQIDLIRRTVEERFRMTIRLGASRIVTTAIIPWSEVARILARAQFNMPELPLLVDAFAAMAIGKIGFQVNLGGKLVNLATLVKDHTDDDLVLNLVPNPTELLVKAVSFQYSGVDQELLKLVESNDEWIHDARFSDLRIDSEFYGLFEWLAEWIHRVRVGTDPIDQPDDRNELVRRLTRNMRYPQPGETDAEFLERLRTEDEADDEANEDRQRREHLDRLELMELLERLDALRRQNDD
jgi:hypothetical protein